MVQATGQTDVEATTDPSGQFNFSDLSSGQWWVLVSDSRFGQKFTEPFTLSDGEARELPAIQVAVPARVSGLILELNGTPASEARVVARMRVPRTTTAFDQSTSADSSGHYELSLSPDTEVSLLVEAKRLLPQEAHLGTVDPGGSYVHSFILSRGATLFGRVLDRAGFPIPDATLQGEGASAVTNGDGTFALEGLPSDGFELMVGSPTHMTTHQTAQVGSFLEIVLDSATSLHGRVTPASARTVSFTYDQSTYRDTLDEQGRFNFERVPVGRIVFRIESPDDIRTVEADVQPGTDLVLDR